MRTESLRFEEFVSLLANILTVHGYAQEVAQILATNCAAAQRDGSVSHGIFRIRNYISTITSGYVDGSALPVLYDCGPGFIRVDAANGFAQIALERARSLLVDKARRNGIAILAIRNSHHTGALYLDVEGFASEGFVALALVNTMAVVAPPGAKHGVYGTNPVAFAAPRSSGAPLVFDQASSTMAHGDVQIALREGRDVPSGSGINKAGQETTDPNEILEGGALLTFGGHKGASIALMVEVLCAALTGADFSFEVDRSKHPGATTARTGETIILIDPAMGNNGQVALADRIDDLVQALTEAGQERIPGDRRIRNRLASDGKVAVLLQDWKELHSLLNMR